MSEVHVMDHPLIQHKIGVIRRKDIGSRAVSYTHLTLPTKLEV